MSEDEMFITRSVSGGKQSESNEFLKMTPDDGEATDKLLESFRLHNIYTSQEVKQIKEITMNPITTISEYYDPTSPLQVLYKPNRGKHPCRPDLLNSLHRGQRKLFIGELQFLTELVNTSKPTTVLYAGSAPAHHHPFLRSLFPSVIWHLYDPADFGIKPLAGITHIYQEPFTIELANSWKGKVDLFICDFRRGDTSDPVEFEIQVAEDMAEQIEWARAMQPMGGTMVKFRPPYIAESSYSTVKYPKGKVQFQTWNSYASSEGRQIILPDELNVDATFDVRHYQDHIAYLNLILRPWGTFNPPAPDLHLVKGYDRCHNCTLEATAWIRYLNKVDYIFQGTETTVSKMMTLAGERLKQYLFIPDAARGKVSTTHMNPDSSRKDRTSKHGDFSQYPAPRRNMMICDNLPASSKRYVTQVASQPKRPILIFGDNPVLQVAHNNKYTADFTPDANENFIAGVSFNCGLQCLVTGDYNNHITTMFKYWNESAIRLRNTPLDLILILGNHDLYWDYFYKYRAFGLSDERFMNDFIMNYRKILNENLEKFPESQITIIGVLPSFASELSFIEPKEDIKFGNLEELRTKHEELTLETIVKAIMDQNRFITLVNNYRKWATSLTMEKRAELYDKKLMDIRRVEINRRLKDYVTSPPNPRIRFINFEDELTTNYEKYLNTTKGKQGIDPNAFRGLLTTVFPGIANYMVKMAAQIPAAAPLVASIPVSARDSVPSFKTSKVHLSRRDRPAAKKKKMSKRGGGSENITPLAVIIVIIILVIIVIILLVVTPLCKLSADYGPSDLIYTNCENISM